MQVELWVDRNLKAAKLAVLISILGGGGDRSIVTGRVLYYLLHS